MTSGYDETLTPGDVGGPAATRLEVGAVFAGRYEVLGLLGAGGMGEVYRVRDRRLDETVALKILTLGSASAVDRFLSEVRLARRVTHPNVARTHDLGEHDGVHFLTMEYVQGEALDRVLGRAGKLEPSRVMEIGAAIANGLTAAHAAGVVHRDLKPANVLLAEDGRIVITDFGIARATDPGASGHHTVGIVGTPHYMSPEQVSGRPVDARSDIYALGLILYELATGALPFSGETPMAAAVARLSQPVPDPRSRASIPDPLALLVLRCLARDPASRPRSASEVAAALEDPDASTACTEVGSSEKSLFAPISIGTRTLAVLPFAYRGPGDHDYLGEGIAEELIDVLARTRGLRVLALGATRRFAEDRDPANVCRELSATSVVDGTLQVAGPKVRLAARLLQPDGVQVWTERFDGRFEDVFALQESMAKRVAEALRLELEVGGYGAQAPREAVDLYLRARRDLRSDIVTAAEGAVAKLERALELAPGLAPLIAYHAMASVRAWWGTEKDEDGAREERAMASVERAKREAGDIAETHLVVAMMAVQRGRYAEAAGALAEALEIAPTMFEAHEYLGQLQLEAGRATEGRRRLELALELNPESARSHLALARDAVLRGDLPRHRHHDEALYRLAPDATLPLVVSRVRWAMWRDDTDAVQEQLERLAGLGIEPAARMTKLFAVLSDPGAIEESRATARHIPSWLANERFTSLMWQIVTEVFAVAGDLDMAFEALERCADGVTIDIEWMRLCPVLRTLRSDPRFAPPEAKIEQRARDAWSGKG